jgi:hypothetical protein
MGPPGFGRVAVRGQIAPCGTLNRVFFSSSHFASDTVGCEASATSLSFAVSQLFLVGRIGFFPSLIAWMCCLAATRISLAE